jgi:hypothetical protein
MLRRYEGAMFVSMANVVLKEKQIISDSRSINISIDGLIVVVHKR